MRRRLRLRDGEDKSCRGENFVRFGAVIGHHAFGIIDRESWVAAANGELAGEQDIDRREPFLLCKQRVNLVRGRRQFTRGESSSSKVATILDGKAAFFIDFLPPLHRHGVLARAGVQPRDSAPNFRFGPGQQVGIARFGAGFAPLFSLDKRERLMRQPARLPRLDHCANARCSEVHRRSECCHQRKRQQEEPPEAPRVTHFGRGQIKIVLRCNPT